MRALICGSRDWTYEGPIKRVLLQLKGAGFTTIIHGDARGADRTAGKWADFFGLEVIKFPANWKRDGIGAGPKRNQQMLDEGKPDRVVAFPLPQSKGTWDMVRRARKAGIPVTVVDDPWMGG